MVLTASTMLPLGTVAPDFSLLDTCGQRVSLANFQEKKGLVVMFLCNHCPYVIHLQKHLKDFANEFLPLEIGFVAINANDPTNYPDDSPEKMKITAENNEYPFPYLFDASQKVAQAYKAACTPDFFLFDDNLKLTYRGQFDESRPGNDSPVTGNDLRKAILATLAGKETPIPQKPSIGCNIKWKPENQPTYFDPSGSAKKL
ncbi:MAG: thioredoxin family protein [Pirellulaceae bacterium]|nr:thioredoxin family protein [Pirellulaceae bacterium]